MLSDNPFSPINKIQYNTTQYNTITNYLLRQLRVVLRRSVSLVLELGVSLGQR